MLHLCVWRSSPLADFESAFYTKCSLGIAVFAGGMALDRYQNRNFGIAACAAAVAAVCMADILAWYCWRPLPKSDKDRKVSRIRTPGASAGAARQTWLRRYGKPVRKVLWESKGWNALTAALVAYGSLQMALAMTSQAVCSSRASATILFWTIDKKNCSYDERVRAIAGLGIKAIALVLAGWGSKSNAPIETIAFEGIATMGFIADAVCNILAASAYNGSLGSYNSAETYRLLSTGCMVVTYGVLLAKRILVEAMEHEAKRARVLAATRAARDVCDAGEKTMDSKDAVRNRNLPEEEQADPFSTEGGIYL